MNWSVAFYPLLPQALLYSAIGLAVVMSLLFLFTKKSGAFLRILTLALFILALANPHLKTEDRQYLKNIAVVVTDESASQKIANREQITQNLKSQLGEQLGKIENLEVRWVTSRDVRTSEEETTSDGTRVFQDMQQALSTIPANRLAGIFTITDGQIHDVPVNPEALGLDVPVHALITGHKQEIDRRIDILHAPRFGIVGSSALIKLKITQHGINDEASDIARLKIMRQDEPPEELQVVVGTELEIPINFPHAGANYVEIELEALPNELTLINNRTAVVAQGVRENLRVLLVSGEPHTGERTWRNLLKSDASVDLVHFTILRPPEKQDGTPINELSLIAFPTRELFSEKLDQFDLIIFDRYRRRGVLPLLYLDNISRYVEKGGAILVATGPTYATSMSLYRTPLAQILPASPTGRVLESAYRAQITNDGTRHPVTRDLPGSGSAANANPNWGSWFRLVQAEAREGQVLMEGTNDNPLLVLNRIGEGRVAVLLSDHAWLWARGFEGGGPHTILLRRLAHWLMQEPDLEEEYLTATGNGYQLTVERRSMDDRIDDIVVQSPRGTEETVQLERVSPGVWRQQLEVDAPGLYRFSSGDLSALAHAGPLNSREMARVVSTEDVIKPILEHTGGGAFWLGLKAASSTDKGQQAQLHKDLPRIAMLDQNRKMYGQNWLALHDRKAYEVKGAKLFPLLNSLLALALLTGFLAITWYREGR